MAFTVFDLLFELIIEMSFEVVAKCDIVKDRGGVAKEAIETEKLLGPVPEGFL